MANKPYIRPAHTSQFQPYTEYVPVYCKVFFESIYGQYLKSQQVGNRKDMTKWHVMDDEKDNQIPKFTKW